VPSRKRSAAKQPDPVLFLDRSLGLEPIRARLLEAGVRVEVHRDHFADDARDEEWLSAIASRGWVILTKDQRIRYRPLELQALRKSHAKVFVLTAGNLKGSEIAAAFVSALPRIRWIAASERQSFLATVSRTGKVRL
jgi:predicted nuclease of predicted toxin-antitoxin system